MSHRTRLAILTIGTIVWIPAMLYTAGFFDALIIGVVVAIAGPTLWWTIYFHSKARER